MIEFAYADYAWQQAEALLAIDSPAGFTGKAALWVKEAFESLGFPAVITGSQRFATPPGRPFSPRWNF